MTGGGADIRFGLDVRRATAIVATSLGLAGCSVRSLELFPDSTHSDASAAENEAGEAMPKVDGGAPAGDGAAASTDACNCPQGCTPCNDDSACVLLGEQLHCDPQSHRCVECSADIHCSVDGEMCDTFTGECGTPCDAGCMPGEFCDPHADICVGCMTGDPCPSGSQSMQGNCGP